MKTDNVSSINFNGGFRLKSLNPEIRAKLPEEISKKGVQIFDNFEKPKDVFVLARDKYDLRIAKFIRENKINFEYYPQINTKSGMDSEKPELLTKLIENLESITSMTQLRKAISNRNSLVEQKSSEYINNILKALKIDNPCGTIRSKHGAKIIDNKDFERRIIISPPSVHNIHFVIIQPYSLDKNEERYAINSAGDILATYKTPAGIKKFSENFKNTLLK